MHIAFTILLLILANTALADKYWTEEIVVADGPTIQVSRSVEYACSGSTFAQMFDKYPCLFHFEFEHPQLPFTVVRWHGIRHVNPVALQVINDIPYLAIYSDVGSSPIHDKPKIYGCPEVPFSFLKYDLKGGEWFPIAPMEVPRELLTANMTAYYRPESIKNGKLSKEDVAQILKWQSQSSGGYFQVTIPRSANEWTYKGKKSFLTSRVSNDCRPPVERVVDVIFPIRDDKTLDLDPAKLKEVDYEVVEDRHFNPPLMIPDAESHTLRFSKETAEKCNSYFARPDPYDQRLITFKGFVADPTGKKFTRNGLNNVYCTDTFNYAFHRIDKNFAVIAKYTKSGDVSNYLKFSEPMTGKSFVDSQSRLEKGFLYLVLSETTWKEGVRGILFTRWLTVRLKVE